MHELAIAQNILEIVQQYVRPDQMKEVRSVRLRIGALSGIVPESLEFCFNAIVSDTAMTGASLDIERVPTRADCPDCGSSFGIDDPVFSCPSCGGRGIKLVSGTELQVVEIGLDDQGAEAL
jgi:hydrogenase nickel incorporation protein HypA/HybF